MDYRQYSDTQQQNTGPRYQPPLKANSLAAGSMITGLLSVVSTFICPLMLTFVCAPVSIILALLSKGYDEKLHSNAKIGIAASVCGLGMNVLMFGGVLLLFLYNPDYRHAVLENYDQVFESVYGTDFNETMKELYGDDFDIYEFFGDTPEAPQGTQELPDNGNAGGAALHSSGKDSFVYYHLDSGSLSNGIQAGKEDNL